MNTSRLTINNMDLSTVLTDESSAVTGYTVVRSKGGPSLPIKFTGSSKLADFTSIFGEGGKGAEDVYEARAFLNAGYDLYVSAPYTTATVPVAAVTDKGIMMMSDPINYSSVEKFAVNGDPVSISTSGKYMIEASKLGSYFTGISVSGIKTNEMTITGSSSDPLYQEFISTGANLRLVKADGETRKTTATVDSGSGKLSYTFDGIDQDTFDSSVLYIVAGTDAKDLDPNSSTSSSATAKVKVKGYIFPKYPTEHSTDVTFGTPSQSTSIVVSDVNNSNKSFNLENSGSEDQQYICYLEIDSSVAKPALNSYARLSFRGCEKTVGNVDKGWEHALDVSDNIDLFFDPACHNLDDSEDYGKFTTSRFLGLATENKYLGLAGYLFNLTAAPSTSDLPVLSFGPNYWNICNQAVINANTSNAFYSSMVGARAAMQAKIIEKNYGGSAPMYINDVHGLGGQLSNVGSQKLRYNFKDPNIRRKFANNNFNVVISDPNYGVLVTSQMTCKSGTLTDWSYIGHVSAFLNLQKLIWDNVMIPQIGKANNPYYRDLRAQQVQRYLDARTGGSDSIWAAATVDTSTAPGVNDIAAQKARKFVIVVKVKVNIFSEEVILNFVNLPQDVNL